jgi:long-chain acyl-CoA synthetase
MSLTQALHRSLQQHPAAIATVYADRQQSFRQLADRVSRLAGALRQVGVKPGDRVAILALNSDHYAECYPAIWWMNALANPVNTRWSAEEILYSDGSSIQTLPLA